MNYLTYPLNNCIRMGMNHTKHSLNDTNSITIQSKQQFDDNFDAISESDWWRHWIGALKRARREQQPVESSTSCGCQCRWIGCRCFLSPTPSLHLINRSTETSTKNPRTPSSSISIYSTSDDFLFHFFHFFHFLKCFSCNFYIASTAW